jgi:hypothetical protein
LGHEELDIQTWADWGVDHIAIDNCDNPNSTAQSIFEYTRIRDALIKVNKVSKHLEFLEYWGNGHSQVPYSGHSPCIFLASPSLTIPFFVLRDDPRAERLPLRPCSNGFSQ